MSETGAHYPAGRSPDGKFLFALNKPSNQPISILLGLDTTTRTVRELFRVDAADAFNHNGGLTYAPDGRAVIATVPNRNGQQDIWWIPVDGRKPHKIALTTPQIAENIIAIHPNGRRIAFLAGRPVEQTVRLLPWYRYIGQPADFRLRELPAER
jgi:Tol biopolymer transport system component